MLFDQYCKKETAQLQIELTMPLLMNSFIVVKNALLPVGQLSKEA